MRIVSFIFVLLICFRSSFSFEGVEQALEERLDIENREFVRLREDLQATLNDFAIEVDSRIKAGFEKVVENLNKANLGFQEEIVNKVAQVVEEVQSNQQPLVDYVAKLSHRIARSRLPPAELDSCKQLQGLNQLSGVYNLTNNQTVFCHNEVEQGGWTMIGHVTLASMLHLSANWMDDFTLHPGTIPTLTDIAAIAPETLGVEFQELAVQVTDPHHRYSHCPLGFYQSLKTSLKGDAFLESRETGMTIFWDDKSEGTNTWCSLNENQGDTIATFSDTSMCILGTGPPDVACSSYDPAEPFHVYIMVR
eukprot:TRINITY_DN32800_c0_g1_i1.p1 TRINITY_DN32800_c0_g1~~TRINITY_DN32800_c0_g1_i1.p1  ORF type:complete len:307 (+),score=31.42 TRINITY_DN32800_c0_g1_i1:1-921(+)